MNKYNKNSVTLDNKHTELLNKFSDNDNILIPNLKKKLANLEKSLNKKKNYENKDNINNDIQKIKNQIYIIEKEKKDYFINNSKYIFDYFEDKKNIDYNNLINDISSKNTLKTINNEKINNFFNSKNNIILDDNHESINENYIKKYFYNIDNLSLNLDNYCYQSDICKSCKNGELIYVEADGICICNNCSKTIKYLIENEKPSYKEPPKEVCFYAYKRINHLREILAQFQAKESTNIPEEVFENIKNQIKKERISLNNLDNKKTKEILKNLGYNKYYEHIPFIKDKLGIKPPIMLPELEEKLCNLFMEIQKPYALFCPKDRVNFLNYYYTLYKLCELLGETNFLPYFPMLKDREKRMEQDDIWKKICEELNWKFIPTV
tara:strand:- start:274 stop:1407 length:1134 start_codon:yes stop_codon:yes gene_type:complete